MSGSEKDRDQYSEEEAQQRFEAVIRAALKTPPIRTSRKVPEKSQPVKKRTRSDAAG